jgi:hypothetical protein
MESLWAFAWLGFWIVLAMTLGSILVGLFFYGIFAIIALIIWAFNKLTGRET